MTRTKRGERDPEFAYHSAHTEHGVRSLLGSDDGWLGRQTTVRRPLIWANVQISTLDFSDMYGG